MLCCAKSTGVACRPEQAASDEARRVTWPEQALRHREVANVRTGIEKSRKVKQVSGERSVLTGMGAATGTRRECWGALFRFEEQG
jgi:hypothetical protein